ncbi:MAG: type II toxin-antitoxin system prevent-host-death family antitoxin [Pseudomonadales bacterium]|jgi:prevent-host-death family protein|nr:type II toxin-antitoxin system prevent-host-death family antitoxin [Pseudomonadales bacterium]
MRNESFSLADAKARLSEMTARAARGGKLLITKRGKPVVQLTPPDVPRKRIDLGRLRALTDSMPEQTESAGEFMRAERDRARY